MPSDGLSCRELADFLSDYLADELQREVRVRFESHLRVCPDCVAYLASFRETLRLARESHAELDAATGDAPAALVAGILDARRRPAARRREP